MYSKLLVAAVAAVAHLTGAQDSTGASIKCPGFIPEEIKYPTPYIPAQERADRCKLMFSRFNSTGTATLGFVGQNTYHNPCKVECGLCATNELPDEKEDANVFRSYPPHISLKDSIVKCDDEVEVYEQYMPDGIRCGPFHLCENQCCVAKPERFPNSKKAKARLAANNAQNKFSQTIPAEWTKPLTCTEEGYFQNPNDCHHFYRCFKTGSRGGFSKTLFECNPSSLVFDPNVKVCVKVDNNNYDEICGGGTAAEGAGGDY